MQIFIPPGTFIALTTPTFMKIYGGWQGILFHFMVIYFAEHFAFFLTYFIGRNIWKIGSILTKHIKYFDAFNNILKTKGAKITFLLRLWLIIPYDVINYIISTTEIPLIDYFIGNHGMVMDFTVSTYIGISVSKVSSMNSQASNISSQILFMIFGTIIVFGIIWYVIRTAQNEFDRLVYEEGKRKKKTIYSSEKLF